MAEPLEEVLATAPGVLYIARVHANGSMDLPYVSRGFEELLGLTGGSPDEVASGLSRIHPDDMPIMLAAIARRDGLRDVVRYNHPTRGWRWIEGRSTMASETPDGTRIYHGFFSDVTERMSAIEAVRASEARLAALIDALPVGILASDAENRVTLANPAAIEIFGLSEVALLGADVGLLLPSHRERLVRTGPSGAEQVLQISRVEEKGATTWMVRDLTHNAELETALRASEQRFAATFRLNPAGVVLVNLADDRVVEVNEAFLRITGLALGEVLGHPLGGVLVPRDPGSAAALNRKMAAHGRLAGEDWPFIRKNHEIGHALVSAEAVAIGAERFVLVVFEDITARRQAEEALRLSEARLREIAENVREVVWLAEPRGSVLYVGPSYERVFGRPPAALYANPRDWLDVVHPEDRARVGEAARTRQVLGTYDEEYRIVQPNGDVRWIHDRAFPVRDASGTVVRIAGVAEDVTERRTLENQLRHAQKMESVGALAGGVAHDFNNLLTIIGGNIRLLEDIYGTADATHAEILQDVREAVDRASALTRQLLSFSRRDLVEPKVVELDTLILDHARMLRRLLGEDVLVETRLGGVPPVRVDPNQWGQVLLNLAVNARDAMPRGGTLLLSTELVGREVVLRVTDTGEGIAPEVLGRVFEPFFTTKANGLGTGLGLAVVHGIVERSGGTIEVHSARGAGTTFTVRLPTAEPVVPLPRQPTPKPQAGTETILLAEDEPAVRRTALRGLRRAGYQVLEAGDGVEALEVLARHGGPVDLLVTDVVMPRMAGRQLAEEATARIPGLKVLYTSGYTDDAVVRYGVSQHEVAFLQKPYLVDALLARVREVLGSR